MDLPVDVRDGISTIMTCNGEVVEPVDPGEQKTSVYHVERTGCCSVK